MDYTLESRLLNEFQRDFPLCTAPFAELAYRLGVAERTVLGLLDQLRREGKISRVGAVFAPKRFGASTLAAMAVPPERLAAVAEAINRFPEVNHNYRREHRYNLWFVVTAASAGRLQSTLGAIEKAAGHAILALPLIEEFNVESAAGAGPSGRHATRHAVAPEQPLGETDRRLVSVLQEGLPLFIRPFALIAERVGASEGEVMGRIGQWLDNGAIKRFGVVVRQRAAAAEAGALLVQDIPDERVAEVGRALAEEASVTLCHRRPRQQPDWPYNLFCTLHGSERAEVEARIADLRDKHGLAAYPHEVLFTR